MRPKLYLARRQNDVTDADAPSIRVVLADDHAQFRKNIRRLLDAESDVEVMADVGDVSAAAEHAEMHRPDVLILDLHVPDTSTITLVRDLRRRFPQTAILILTMERSAAFARQMLAAGAAGYVLKEHANTDLAEAIRRAHAGQRFVSAKLAAALEVFENVTGEDGLTGRELEVLRLTALGYTANEIAQRLHLSSRTVETHRARLHEKLELRSRAELVQYALGRGLLEPEVSESDLSFDGDPRA